MAQRRRRRRTLTNYRLQRMLGQQREKDLKLLIDFNAMTGADNSRYEHVMGKHGIGRMNENGEPLADFCVFNNMVTACSIFPRKDIHRATWRFPDFH